MTTATTSHQNALSAQHDTQHDVQDALKFITCGSVDDGKSTLIGRLLVDTKAVLQDQLAGVQRSGETDLALLTDGLSAEREQGITIDVAYRYFATEKRKFIIGDAPGHEQYTRNMVTAASSADAAVVLVDASKLDWQNPALELLPQTRRHSLLLSLLRVDSIVFAVNKLDAVENAEFAFSNISAALSKFTSQAKIKTTAIVPISALKGWNVVDAKPGWASYSGPSLLQVLENLSTTPAETEHAFSFPVQWVEKFSSSADISQGRRIFWGRVATGRVQVGQTVTVFPSGKTATVAQVLDRARRTESVNAGQSAGIVLDREVDVSRGDWILEQEPNISSKREIKATIAWLDDEPLVAGRAYWALHGHRWVKAKIKHVVHKLDIHTLAELEATLLAPNDIGHVEIVLQEPIVNAPYSQSRNLGSLVLVDTASHRTAGAVLIS
ncbi:MAG TPA: GTP-binding protein [Burkholderiaceae bacterium]|nr:GTP-binding protein [Burkholderiaceae bacterium]